MKIAVQENLLPGETLGEKLDLAESLGVDGLEVQGRSRLYDQVEAYERALNGRQIKISSICGQSTFDWLDPDPAKRAASIAETRRNLDACGHFGAVGHVMPPIFGPPRIPDLSPWMDAISMEKALLVEIVKDLADYAYDMGTLLLLEPLNRYEQHLLRRQADGVEIIQDAGTPPGVALLSDFFHMHIEETNTPQTFRQLGRYVGHVHVADNTRLQPGSGDIDWRAGLQALNDIGFNGYLAYECRLAGDPATALRESITFIREIIASLD